MNLPVKKKITEVLNKYNIKYEREKRFDDCKNKKALPFDFYLPDYNILIEYNGLQHYKDIDIGRTELALIQHRDSIKKKYCEDNNIQLIIIPYWDKDKIEDILINAFDLVEQH